MLLMRGSVSPLRTRRSSASDDGRVLVGSRPTRLYIVRTEVTSAGGFVRTAASAAARGALNRGSRSTTVAPSSHSTPARTIVARSAEVVKRIVVSGPMRYDWTGSSLVFRMRPGIEDARTGLWNNRAAVSTASTL